MQFVDRRHCHAFMKLFTFAKAMQNKKMFNINATDNFGYGRMKCLRTLFY